MRLKHLLLFSSAFGLAVFLGLLGRYRPDLGSHAWPGMLVVFAALVLVPLTLRRIAPADPARIWWAVSILLTPAALALVASITMPMGQSAGLATLPWVGITAMIALLGVKRLVKTGWRQPGEASIAVGMIYLSVGGGWTFLARYGASPLDFASIIVLLTAVHFHYAGFVLPILAGLAATSLGGRFAAISCGLVVIAVPAVAVGITATRLGMPQVLESIAGISMAIGGVLAAVLQLRLSLRPGGSRLARLCWGLSGVSLIGGMGLAALYSARGWMGQTLLEIPAMQAWHGSINAFGFAFLGAVGWNLDRPSEQAFKEDSSRIQAPASPHSS